MYYDVYYSKKERRFLVIDVLQLILVEPDGRRLGWGVVKFVGFLQVGRTTQKCLWQHLVQTEDVCDN